MPSQTWQHGGECTVGVVADGALVADQRGGRGRVLREQVAHALVVHGHAGGRQLAPPPSPLQLRQRVAHLRREGEKNSRLVKFPNAGLSMSRAMQNGSANR